MSPQPLGFGLKTHPIFTRLPPRGAVQSGILAIHPVDEERHKGAEARGTWMPKISSQANCRSVKVRPPFTRSPLSRPAAIAFWRSSPRSTPPAAQW